VDLQKVEQLESKINTELDMLRSKIDTMTEELDVYSDIDRLRKEAEIKKMV
jgi:predicted ribosome quality control (RQC) complex YloA/Tae2 family protein